MTWVTVVLIGGGPMFAAAAVSATKITLPPVGPAQTFKFVQKEIVDIEIISAEISSSEEKEKK